MTSATADALAIALERDADVPLGVQLAWALRARIAAGRLRPGDRLPALHRLAADAGVNVNTIRAVYARLEQDGLVTTRHGSGTFVSQTAGAREPLARLAADAANAAQAAGVDPRELAAALYVSGEAAPARTDADGDEEAAARRRLRGPIAALEQALSELTARKAAGTGTSAGEERTPRPRLLTAAELAAQRDALLQRLADAQRGP